MRLLELAKVHGVVLTDADGWKRLALSLIAAHDPKLRYVRPVRPHSARQLKGTVGTQIASRIALHAALPEMPAVLREPGLQDEREGWEEARQRELADRRRNPTAWNQKRFDMAFARVVEEECKREGLKETHELRDGVRVEKRAFAKIKDRLKKQLAAFATEFPEYFSARAGAALPKPAMTSLERIVISYSNHMSALIAAADEIEQIDLNRTE